MAWAGISIKTRGAILFCSGISATVGGDAPLAVYSDSDLTTGVEFPVQLVDDPTVYYVDLGSTSQLLWVNCYQDDDSAINRSVEASTHVVVDVDPTPSYDQVLGDVSRIDAAVSTEIASLTLEVNAKADKSGDDDLIISTSSSGLVLTSPNGTSYRIKVTDAGVVTSSTYTP